MGTATLPSSRYQPTISEGEGEVSECGQIRGSGTESLPDDDPEPKPTPLTADQWKLVTTHLETAKRVVKKVYAQSVRTGTPADYDELYDYALDFLIDAVRKLTEGHFLEQQLKTGMHFLSLRLLTAASDRHKQRWLPKASEDELEAAVAPSMTDVIELYLEEYDLPRKHRRLLTEVMYLRSDESPYDRLSRSDYDCWRKMVLPPLRRWAVRQGLWSEEVE